MHPRVQKITLQRFQQAVAILQGGDAAQRFLHRALAAADQLLALPGKIDLLQRVGPLPRKDLLYGGQRYLMAQKRFAHARGGVQRMAARQRGADASPDQAVADGLRQRAHVLYVAGSDHKQDHFTLVDVGDGGLRTGARIAQHWFKNVRELFPVLCRIAADDPHRVDRGDVNVKNISQAAHLHRLVLQDGADQLADDDAVVLVRPDAHRQLYDLDRLPGEYHVKRAALLEDEQIHRVAFLRLDAVAVNMYVHRLAIPPCARGGELRRSQPFLDGVVNGAGPGGLVQHAARAVHEYDGGVQPVRQHAQHAVHRPLVRQKARRLLKQFTHQIRAGHLVAVDQLHDLADHFAVTLVHLPHGHADQGKIKRVRHLDELAVYLFHDDADVKEDDAHLANGRHAAKVGTLKLHVVRVVHKTGDGQLVAEKFDAVEQLRLDRAGLRVFQYGDGRYHPRQPACAAKHLRSAHGRQLHDIRDCNAHCFIFCPFGQIQDYFTIGALREQGAEALFLLAGAIRTQKPLGQGKCVANIQIVISKMKLVRRFVKSSPKIPQTLPGLKMNEVSRKPQQRF